MVKSNNRKAAITQTAIDIIDEKGIQGLSIRELARRQEMTEPALYRHFASKEAIVLSVLEVFAEAVQGFIQQIEADEMAPPQAILAFIRFHTDYFTRIPQMTAVVFSEEIFRDTAIVAERMQGIFKLRSAYVAELVAKGLASSRFRQEFSQEELTDLIMGLLRRMTLKWRLNHYSFPLTEKTITTLNKLLQVCSPE